MRQYLGFGCGLACWALILVLKYVRPQTQAEIGLVLVLAALSVLAALGSVIVFLLALRQRRVTAVTVTGLVLGAGWFGVLIASWLLPCPAPSPRSRLNLCTVRLYAVYSACREYAKANQGRLPSSLDDLESPLEVGGVQIVDGLRCPGRDASVSRDRAPRVTYSYVTGLRIDDPPHYIVAFDGPHNHAELNTDHGTPCNVLYLLGAVDTLDAITIRKRVDVQITELAAQGRVARVEGGIAESPTAANKDSDPPAPPPPNGD